MATVSTPLPPAPAASGLVEPPELDSRAGSKAVVASQWRLMYWRFRRHRLAVAATFVVLAFYLVALFCEFLAPMDPNKVSNQFRYVPPQGLTFVNHEGKFSLRPGVHGLKQVRNPETLRVTYEVDKNSWTPVQFFVQGDSYKLWGLFRTNVHLIGLGKTPGTLVTTAVAPTSTPSSGGATTGAAAGAGAAGGSTGLSVSGFSSSSTSATPAPGSSSGTGAGTSSGSTGLSVSGFSSAGGSANAPAATRAPATATVPASATARPTTTSGPATSASNGASSTQQEVPFFLLGTDRLGRDMLSRMMYGARVSLSIGLVGVALSLIFGIILGGISGYYGGTADNLIQRLIEFIRSLPTIPLWLALAAAMPPKWPPTYVYFAITVILSLFGWTGLARVVRGRFLALREEDFILAARFTNCSESRIIFRHMVPAFTSHLIASVTLALPGMILSETSLSFLGLGLRPPVISWGVLLQEAQNIQTVALFPWLLLPCLPIVAIILAFNFMGDGLRDAADPYGR